MNPTTKDAIWLGARRVLAFILLFSIGVNILMLTAPLYMLQVYDRVLSSGSRETLIYLSVIAIVALMVLGALDISRKFAMVRLSEWIDRTLSAPMLSWTLERTSRNKEQPSTIHMRDINALRSYLSSEAPFAVMDMPWVLVFVTIVFLLHTALGLVALSGAILLLVLVVMNQVMTHRSAHDANVATSQLSQVTESIVRNADVIEAMGLKSQIAKSFDSDKSSVLSLNRKFFGANTFFSVTTKFLRMGLQVAILGVGALLAIGGEITPGAMIAGSILMGRALAPIELAVGTWRQSLNAIEAFKRIEKELSSIDAKNLTTSLPEPRGLLTVDGVSYVHPGQSEPTLLDLSFQLAPGELLGVIGPMGTGKAPWLECWSALPSQPVVMFD